MSQYHNLHVDKNFTVFWNINNIDKYLHILVLRQHLKILNSRNCFLFGPIFYLLPWEEFSLHCKICGCLHIRCIKSSTFSISWYFCFTADRINCLISSPDLSSLKVVLVHWETDLNVTSSSSLIEVAVSNNDSDDLKFNNKRKFSGNNTTWWHKTLILPLTGGTTIARNNLSIYYF